MIGKENEDQDQTKYWSIGFDSSADPRVMIVTIPFAEWAEDKRNGEILARGFFDLVKNVALQNMAIYFKRKQKLSIVTPNGNIKPN